MMWRMMLVMLVMLLCWLLHDDHLFLWFLKSLIIRLAVLLFLFLFSLLQDLDLHEKASSDWMSCDADHEHGGASSSWSIQAADAYIQWMCVCQQSIIVCICCLHHLSGSVSAASLSAVRSCGTPECRLIVVLVCRVSVVCAAAVQ